MSGARSRRKGKVGELEACHALESTFGWKAKRSAPMQAGHGGAYADIVCDQTPSLFLEVKRVEKLNVQRALATAVKQAGRRCPVLLHRTNRSPLGWLLTLRLEDLPRLAHAYQVAEDDTVAQKALPNDNAGHRPGGAVDPRRSRHLSDRGRAGTDSPGPIVRANDGGDSA